MASGPRGAKAQQTQCIQVRRAESVSGTSTSLRGWRQAVWRKGAMRKDGGLVSYTRIRAWSGSESRRKQGACSGGG